MKRIRLIQFHLGLAAFFTPFMLLMPLSGVLHLADVGESQSKTAAFTITDVLPEDKAAHEEFFLEQFKKQSLDFSFEYIRYGGKDFTFRPSSRVHYMASQTDAGLEVYKLVPNLGRRIMEIHKGHGPQFMRWVQGGFGVAMILVTLSGIWLAVTIPAYRRIMLGSVGAGALLILLALL